MNVFIAIGIVIIIAFVGFTVSTELDKMETDKYVRDEIEKTRRRC